MLLVYVSFTSKKVQKMLDRVSEADYNSYSKLSRRYERGHYMNGLAERRQKLKLRQIDVANALGVTRIAVHNWENGKAFPTASKLLKLASVLKCDVVDILRERG